MKTFFWCDLPEEVFMYFSANVGRHLCPDFSQLFRDFARIFNKSKFWGALAPPEPPALTPLCEYEE